MKINNKFILVVFGLLVIITGLFLLKNNKEEKISFFDLVNKVDTNSYQIHDISSSASSGGGRSTDTVREITPDELSVLINEVKSVKIENYFLDGNKKCFYNLNDHGGPMYLLCIAQNKIVNYIRTDGPSTTSWSILGFENINRSTIISSLPDLQSCNVDKDCTLEGVGVCIPEESFCKDNNANCDSGYRLPINNKYSFVWGGLNYTEDKCIVNNIYVSYEKGEYYKATCENNMCKTSVVKGS